MQTTNRSRLMLIFSMAIFGTLGWFVDKISVSSGELALYRAVMAAVLIGLFLLISRQKIPFQQIKKELFLLLISGCAMGFNWILLFEAYKYTTVSVATLSYYFAPVLVTLICPILFKEKMGLRQWLCFILSTLGIVLITGLGNLSDGSNHLLGIGFGLGAACLYATVILLNKTIKTVTGLHRTFLQFLAAIAVLVPYVLLSGGVTLQSLDAPGWLCLLAVGIVHTGIAYCLYFSSLKELPGQQVAILSYIDPLVAVVMSVTVMGDAVSLPLIAGGVLILGSTLYNELSSK
ncbi:MAG: EamA family transporter [Oscillospiraceae bacterium]|nr:EamA family transporter [Oscillospiraceae bacterium]